MLTRLSVVLLVFFVPLAAAGGPAVSVATLANGSHCSSDSTSQGGGSWWDDGGNGTPPTSYGGWWWNDETHAGGCSASSDTLRADASDDAGPLAAARVYHENASSHAGSSSDNGNYAHYPGEYRFSDWSSGQETQDSTSASGARASVLGTAADVGDHCAASSESQSSGYDDTSSWSSTDTYANQGSHASQQSATSHSRCTSGAGASDAGHGAWVGRLDQCDSSDASHGYGSYQWSSTSTENASSWSSYSSGQSQGSATSDCRSGAAASAEGNDLFAGRRDTCSSSGWSQSQNQSGDGLSYAYYASSDRSSCFHGYEVDGIDGMRATLGDSSTSHTDCWDSCVSRTTYQSDLVWTWEGSPVAVLGSASIGLPTLLS